MTTSNFEWNDNLKQFKPIGFKKETNKMSKANNENVQTYELTRKNGRVDTIRFTGKRGEILEMLLAGKSNDEVIAAGFSKHTVSVVKWQAGKVGLLNETTDVEVAS